MCVIAFSPAGVAIPKEEDLKLMFQKNKHGAGFAITKPDGFVEWHKGYMDFESLMSKLKEFSEETMKDNPVTIHFRITTKGKTDAETTHPFPLSPQFSDMRKLHGITQQPVIFHNGSIPGFGGIGAEVASDTQDFVMGPMFYIMKGLKPGRKIGALRETTIEQLMGSSRLLIQMANGETVRLGTTWTQHTDGCFYSNMLWKPSTVKTATATTAPSTYGYGYGYYGSRAVATTKTEATSQVEAKKEEVEEKPDPKEPDEYGRHSYPGAWPGKDKEWIVFKTPEIREKACKYMTTIIRDGEEVYKEKISGNIYMKHGEKDLLTEEGLELMAEYYIDQYGDDIQEAVKDGQLNFETLAELEEFLEACIQNQDGTYFYEGVDWYADYDAISLYTYDFLAGFFPENTEQVIESLLKDGYIDEGFIELIEEDEADTSKDETLKAIQEELAKFDGKKTKATTA